MADDDQAVIVVDTAPAAYSVIEVVTNPIAEFEVETRGPQGEAGEQGAPGIPSVGAAVEYKYDTPVYAWEGTHPYIGRPTVILLDDSDPPEVFLGRVTYPRVRYDPADPELGLVVVLFSVPQAGTLEIRA